MEPPSAAKVNKEQLCALPYPDPLGFDFSMGFSEKWACVRWSDEDQDADGKLNITQLTNLLIIASFMSGYLLTQQKEERNRKCV